MRGRYSLVASFVLILTGLVLTTGISAWGSDTFAVLYDFDYTTGAYSMGDLIFDSAGNLYGTTADGGLENPNCINFYCGVVFELSPSGGSWTYTVLYYFTGGADGGQPHGRLTLDSKGNLYGTTYLGGTVVDGYCSTGCGTVFELSPSGGNWTFTLLHSFDGSDGVSPRTGLTPDSSGNLYGTTSGDGGSTNTVFELSPSGGSWTFSTLYSFTNWDEGLFPYSDLAIDSAGNLYGATLLGGSSGPNCVHGDGCGTLFELSPSDGSWKFSLLHTFKGVKEGAKSGDGVQPWGPLALDSAGNLYGTTNGGGEWPGFGTVFKLSQSAGKWKEQILHRFSGHDGQNPLGGVTVVKGNLYGTTSAGDNCSNCGTVFQLTPNRKGSGWKFTSLYSFTDGADGGGPYAGVISDASGNLYGTTTYGGGAYNSGTLFELSPQ